MKRFVLAIILLTAAGVAVFLALNRPGAEASPDVTITVNDTGDTNNRDDNVLTLREAMLLATGVLTVDVLYHAECDQVSGAIWLPYPILDCFSSDPPGAASADTIVFDTTDFPPGNPKTISLSAALPILDTGDDTVDGSAAGVIVNGPAGGLTVSGSEAGVIGAGVPYACFEISSDNNTIKGMEIYGCSNGVVISGRDNFIGGFDSGEGNVISGHVEAGVRIAGSTAITNGVVGNYIGTNADGDAAVPNGVGVEIASGAQSNFIGTPPPGRGNLISGNDQVGVRIAGFATTINGVVNNYIGTDASGTAALPNNVGGVEIGDGAWLNAIGYHLPGCANIIAFNGDYGVLVKDNSVWNPIHGNSIHSNGGKGISLVGNGNLGRQPPIIEGVGPVFGTACADCDVDIYSDDEDEGRVYEGSTTADGDGKWTFSGSPQGPNVTATATDSNRNTSEFSAPVALSEPTPTPSPSPSPTPTATPTGTPTPGATRTFVWTPGWHNATWSGASTPEEAFACAAGKYAAAYRLVGGVWERYFPDRPEISNMGSLEQYDAFLILITEDVTCEMPLADPAAIERTLAWGVGWQNDGWTGADGTAPQDAFACAAGSYAAAYRLVGGGWERYFPDQPGISNMGPLDEYDAFLIQVTAPVSCSMAITP